MQPTIPLNLDTRNVRNEYKTLELETIADRTRATRSELIACFVNVAGDFNKATGIRNAAFFNIGEVVILGNKRWDKRGAVGAWNYINVRNVQFEDAMDWFAEMRGKDYVLYGVENNIDFPTTRIDAVEFPSKTVVLFGEEGDGLPDWICAECDTLIEIPGNGVMRSLNVGVTSGIIIYEYDLQHRKE